MKEYFPSCKVDLDDTAMELKCSVVIPVLMYLEEKHGKDTMRQVVFDTRMNLNYLRDSRNWVSLDYHCRLLDKLVEVTGDTQAPFWVAQQYSSKVSYGPIAQLVIHLGSPASAYRLVTQIHSTWDRICEYQMLKLESNSCTMKLRFPRHRQRKTNCLAIQGSLAAVPHQFGLPAAKIRELQCVCENGDACVYEITWIGKPDRVGGAAGFAIGLGFGALAEYVTDFGALHYAFALLLSLIGYFTGRELDYKAKLGAVYQQNEEQAQSLLESLRATEKLNEELHQRVEERTEELSKANKDLQIAIQDLKESEKKVIIAERQSAVGVLAGGMAHEVNNPVNAIRLVAQGVLEDANTRGNAELGSQIEVVLRATERCKRIISEMLSFSREPDAVIHVSIVEILEKSVALFQTEHPEGIDINKWIAPNLPLLRLDKIQIQQAIINLFSNALDAMNGKGRVDVSLTSDAQNVVLAVKDYGPGISENLITRIFDPFYTTKENGAGIGMGLSITYQNVRRNGGTIDVQSAPGQGATFLIRFPVDGKKEERAGKGMNS